jgi:hypothetical protein
VKVNVEPAGNRLRATATSFRLEDLDLSGPFSLRLIEADTGDALLLDAWTRVDFDWDEDARVDDSAHEFVGLVFPVGEELLFSRFLGKELVVEFENGSAENLVITGLELDYGNVPRTSYRVPPPRIQNLKVADLALEFEMEALQFETYIVERSTDLQVWTPVLTNQPFSEITSIRLPISGSEAGSYRLRWQESSP